MWFDSGPDACWDGASVKGTFAVGTTWNTFHGNTAFGFGGANFTLNHPRIFNYGDGISIREGMSSNFLISDAYMSYIHDDCVQNDSLVAGTVTNSYLDGCYVAFSARRSDGTTFDGHLNTWTISNSLVRLQAMPTVYKGSAAGHGGFFKWDDSALLSPKLNISNTIFRADQNTNHGTLVMPAGYDVTCSNNTMVWLGPGAFPGTLPSCFTLTTNRAVWDTAARDWDTAHPGVITGPEVSVGDASIVEGTTGARAMQFPISLSEPPAAGKTVTVYWSTAPGTAGSSDFATKKGKVVFSGAQVFKMVQVAVRPDATDEQNELMYVVAAGVDGGENHRERGTGTIVDDDPGSTSGMGLVVSDATVVEGDSGTPRTLVVPDRADELGNPGRVHHLDHGGRNRVRGYGLHPQVGHREDPPAWAAGEPLDTALAESALATQPDLLDSGDLGSWGHAARPHGNGHHPRRRLTRRPRSRGEESW